VLVSAHRKEPLQEANFSYFVKYNIRCNAGLE
jgi:hypothetical protein